jgi:hypothetical protein
VINPAARAGLCPSEAVGTQRAASPASRRTQPPPTSPTGGWNDAGCGAHAFAERGRVRAAAMARLLGVLSLWSENSVLSICSQDSVLSIGSAASFASFASVGSFASAGSILSAMSWASLMSYQSAGSALSRQSNGSVLSIQADRAFHSRRAHGRVPAGAVAAGVQAVLVAIALHRLHR